MVRKISVWEYKVIKIVKIFIKFRINKFNVHNVQGIIFLKHKLKINAFFWKKLKIVKIMSKLMMILRSNGNALNVNKTIIYHKINVRNNYH